MIPIKGMFGHSPRGGWGGSELKLKIFIFVKIIFPYTCFVLRKIPTHAHSVKLNQLFYSLTVNYALNTSTLKSTFDLILR